MCGIAGICDLKGVRKIDEAALKRMTDALSHRGPDGDGFFAAPGIGLGHRRLAIIDKQGGGQPFKTASGAGVLSFNGEIYNFAELRERLGQKGVRFRTRSDTEVLAEGLDHFPDEFTSALRGMFAFAFWSGRDQRLTLARDPLGEKPLYYAETADGFLIFASEIGAIAASGLIELEHDLEAFCDYLHLGYTPDPKTIYKGVRKLPPGSTLSLYPGFAPRFKQYWQPNFTTWSELSFDEAASALTAKLDGVVKSQLVSDVPLGAFLSGGVDSGAIVAAMAQSAKDVTTCTIGFEEDSHDERSLAAAVAERYETDHHEELASLDVSTLIDRIAGVYGEPFADASALPTYMVCGLARKHVTVALTGDGGDEVFGGYRRYPFFLREETIRAKAPLPARRALFGTAAKLYPKADWAPRPLRLKTTLQSLAASRADAYLRAAGANLPERAQRLMSGDVKKSLAGYRTHSVLEAAFAEAGDLDPLSAAQYVDFKTWLPGRMLTKVDRASMAHSLETRAPFLDRDLVDWAGALPPDQKLQMTGLFDAETKRVLKKANEARLDRTALYRPKQGFGLPLAAWLRVSDNNPLDRLKASKAWRESGLFNVKAVGGMAGAHRSGRADNSQELWTVIMFDAFLQNGGQAL